jgi:hypothetical protein
MRRGNPDDPLTRPSRRFRLRDAKRVEDLVVQIRGAGRASPANDEDRAAPVLEARRANPIKAGAIVTARQSRQQGGLSDAARCMTVCTAITCSCSSWSRLPLEASFMSRSKKSCPVKPTRSSKGPRWGRGEPKAGYSFQIKADPVVVRNEAVSSPDHGRDKIGLVPFVRDGRACHDPHRRPADAPLVAMVLQRSWKNTPLRSLSH